MLDEFAAAAGRDAMRCDTGEMMRERGSEVNRRNSIRSGAGSVAWITG